jgi:NADPH-dependent glutamate synthase beta subunit-like oxidoreductase
MAAVRVAVVGGGPAGLFTAHYLLKVSERVSECGSCWMDTACRLTVQNNPRVFVDVFERLPTPFGLVRSGVAPDHADVKRVTTQLDAVLGEQSG